MEFFVFNSDGSFQKYYKPASVASDNQYTFLVNAGSLTILTAANQNLGEPSPAPASLADFKKSSSYKELSLDGTNSRSDISTSLGFAMAAEGTANVVEGEVTVAVSNGINASLIILCIALGVAVPNIFARRYIAKDRQRFLKEELQKRRERGKFLEW